MVVSGKFINNSGRFHCGVAYFCYCAAIAIVGEVAKPIGLGCTLINPAIGSVVPFFIFGNLPRYGLLRSATLAIALHLELCTSPSVALIAEVHVVVGEGELIVP